MSPIFLKLGAFVVHWYSVMLVLAMFAAARIVKLEALRLGWDKRASAWLAVKCTLIGLVGAHLLYAGTRLDLSGAAWWRMLFDPRYGHVWFGGFLSSWAYCSWHARRHGIARYQMYDVAALAVLVAQPIGRLGCFLEGCCYGRPTNLPWGVIMKHSEFGSSALHPVQLYEALYLSAVFLVLWSRREATVGTGRVAAAYLILAPLGRIGAELFRGDTVRGFVVGGLSTSSFISLLLLLGATLFGLLRSPLAARRHAGKSA